MSRTEYVIDIPPHWSETSKEAFETRLLGELPPNTTLRRMVVHSDSERQQIAAWAVADDE